MFIRSEQTVEVQFIHFDSVSHSVTLLPLHCELAPADKTHREPTENTSHGLILKVCVCACVCLLMMQTKETFLSYPSELVL